MDITPKNGPKKTHPAAPKKAKPGAFFVGAAEGEGTREAPARHGKVRVSPATEVGASRLQRPVKIRGGRAAIYEEIRAGDEGAFFAHQQFRHIGHLVRRAGTAGRTLGKHVLVKVPPGGR